MNTPRQKNISIDKDLLAQVEALCAVLHTNFSSKTKELLVEWKINELNRLKEKAPELYAQYQEAIRSSSDSRQ